MTEWPDEFGPADEDEDADELRAADFEAGQVDEPGDVEARASVSDLPW